MQLVQSILDQVQLNTVVDVGITALLIYGLFSLIRGTRAVSLVIGVTVMLLVYAAARFFDLRLLRQVLPLVDIAGHAGAEGLNGFFPAPDQMRERLRVVPHFDAPHRLLIRGRKERERSRERTGNNISGRAVCVVWFRCHRIPSSQG